MQTWTDVTYKLPDDALLVTTSHKNGLVSFSCPGYALDGRGFTLQFTTAHLPQLQQLVRAIEEKVVETHAGAVLHTLGTDYEEEPRLTRYRCYNPGESLVDFEAWRDNQQKDGAS